MPDTLAPALLILGATLWVLGPCIRIPVLYSVLLDHLSNPLTVFHKYLLKRFLFICCLSHFLKACLSISNDTI